MAGFHVRDHANSENALTRTRGKPKGRLIVAEVYADVVDRDEAARRCRERGLKAIKFARIIHADNTSITTYILIVREQLPK